MVHMFIYSVFPSNIDNHYYHFNILLYASKYFLKIPFWIVNSDHVKQQISYLQFSVLPVSFLLLLFYIHTVVNHKD